MIHLRPRPRRRSIAGFATVAASAVVLSAVLSGGGTSALAAAAADACGAQTAATIATADQTVLTDVYLNELSGTEVSDDLAHVTGAADLIAAVASNQAAATDKAVRRIVFHPSWHIVELSVFNASGQWLDTIGGPYAIAPIAGVLKSASGAVVGSFIMSVQDDVGVTKLESGFVGDPIAIYLHGHRRAELGANFPSTPPRGRRITRDGVSYEIVEHTYAAFPKTTLIAVLLIRAPAPRLRAQTCDTVRADEFGRVAMRLRNLLGPLEDHLYGYAYWVRIYTGAEVFIRGSDGTPVASSGDAGPPELPRSGTIGYDGTTWLVFSFAASASTIVYVLIPPA